MGFEAAGGFWSLVLRHNQEADRVTITVAAGMGSTAVSREQRRSGRSEKVSKPPGILDHRVDGFSTLLPA